MAEGQTEQKQDEPRYDADYFMERAARDFEQPAHVVAGALAATERKTHTADQAKDAVRRFLKREIPPYDGAPEHEVPEEARS